MMRTNIQSSEWSQCNFTFIENSQDAEQKSGSTPNKIGFLPAGKTACSLTISPSPVSKFQISVDLKMNFSKNDFR